MQIENRNAFDHSMRKGINLFLGAGFSVLAENIDGRSLPVGSELKSDLESRYNKSSFSLGSLCTIIESTQRDSLQDYLRYRFTVHVYDSRYLVLPRINIEAIFSTNIDDLIYKIFNDSVECYINDINNYGPVFGDSKSVDYIPLHGNVKSESSNLRFRDLDVASAFASDSRRWNYLKSRILKKSTLFWGYGIQDSGALQSLSEIEKDNSLKKDMWAVVYPGKDVTETTEYFHALGLHVITATTEELLDYFEEISCDIIDNSYNKLEPTSLLFPDDCIPGINTTPSRPILDFFLGEPPRWSDIYSGQITETSYLAKCKDAVLSKKHVAIIGLPASGKSTLLMQLASSIDVNKHKIFIEQLSVQKAEYINRLTRNIEGELLIFIDRFADDINGPALLEMNPKVQMVCSDRDHNFDIVTNKIRIDSWEVINITELSSQDIQKLRDTIPQRLKRDRKTYYNDMSLYEFIESSISAPTLVQRFRGVLTDLEKRDDKLLQLLLMMTYLDKCRVPISMDVIVAFLGNQLENFMEAYTKIEQLGSLIKEKASVEFVSFNEEAIQDYFQTRSQVIANAIWTNAKPKMLAEMLYQFNETMSPIRIPRYHIFKRNGNDSEIVLKAFPNVEEGKKYYEWIISQNNDAYLYQHYALYLMKKKQFKEAFINIDKAISIAGFRNWTIKNSHAVIMFKANIDNPENPEARESLDKSMQTLTKCYKNDYRKPYHIITYADQAMKFWTAYGDESAMVYLKQAKTWLDIEKRDSHWHRGINWASKTVDRILANNATI